MNGTLALKPNFWYHVTRRYIGKYACKSQRCQNQELYKV